MPLLSLRAEQSWDGEERAATTTTATTTAAIMMVATTIVQLRRFDLRSGLKSKLSQKGERDALL